MVRMPPNPWLSMRSAARSSRFARMASPRRSSARSPVPLAPACLGAVQKGRRIAAFRAGREGLKPAHEAGLAVVRDAHSTHGFLPIGGETRPFVAVSGVLEIGKRSAVVLTFLGIDDAHSLSAPEPGGKARMRFLQLLRRVLGGVVAHLLQSAVGSAAHQSRKTFYLFGVDE